jgi:hypothetical protein
MRGLRTFLLEELLLAQVVPGFLLCAGWSVMYEIYHEDGSYYTTLMQEILGGEGLFPYFLVSALLMAVPVGLAIDTVREVVGERWLGLPRTRMAREVGSSPLHLILQPLPPLNRLEERYALYRLARASLLIPAKAAGNVALVLLILLVWFVVKIVRMQGWHVFSWLFILGTPVFGFAIVAALCIRYETGLSQFRRMVDEILPPRTVGAPPSPGGVSSSPHVASGDQRPPGFPT